MNIDKRESRFMSNPVRQFFLKHFEFKVFKKILKAKKIDLTNKVILDAGCGPGYGSELILKEFSPKELVAFDIMEEEVALAKKRGLPMNVFVGDMTDTKLPSEKFDAVFIFCVLHHISQWPKALKEINRVLKVGGVLLVEEPNKLTLDMSERYLKIYHPRESRFEWSELTRNLKESGFHITGCKKVYWGFIKSFVCIKSRNIN